MKRIKNNQIFIILDHQQTSNDSSSGRRTISDRRNNEIISKTSGWMYLKSVFNVQQHVYRLTFQLEFAVAETFACFRCHNVIFNWLSKGSSCLRLDIKHNKFISFVKNFYIFTALRFLNGFFWVNFNEWSNKIIFSDNFVFLLSGYVETVQCMYI